MAVCAVAGGVGMLDKFKAYGFQALSLVLGIALAATGYLLVVEKLEHSDLKVAVAAEKSLRAAAALTEETQTAQGERTHANDTQENSDAFTTTQPVRDDAARADLARLERLRLGAERRAATYRAQARANEEAGRHLAGQLIALDAHIVEGVAVVGGLRKALEQRDAEVVLLARQVDIERALSNPQGATATQP